MPKAPPVHPVDLLATLATWTWFVATLVAFDPVLRVASLFGAGALDGAVSLMCRVLSWCIPLGFSRLRIGCPGS